MKRVAQFKKVSLKEFIRAIRQAFPLSKGRAVTDEELELNYNSLSLPQRATTGSAGYDFFVPYDIVIPPHGHTIVPSGYKVKLEEGYVLKLYPRSSLGFNFNMTLANTVGIIDSDYYNNPTNEGHIMDMIINGSDQYLELKCGERYVQGVIERYYITYDDNVLTRRTGGIGSTNGK